MKVIAVKFKEVVPVPHSTRDVVGSIYPDAKGDRFDMIYDRPAHMIVIVNRKDPKQAVCVPLANVLHFDVAPEHIERLMKGHEKAQEQPQNKR